jgi:hypothetical protein
LARCLHAVASAALKTGVLVLLLVTTSVVQAQSHSSHAELAAFVKDDAFAELLGQTLFWDTVEVVGATPSAAPASVGAERDSKAVGTAQVVQTLLAHRSLDKYMWLIQQAFSDSVWKGRDRTQVEKNFALIWRVSIRLYESTLDSGSSRLRVCRPSESVDGLECHDESAPAVVVRIPSQFPVFGRRGQDETG